MSIKFTLISLSIIVGLALLVGIVYVIFTANLFVNLGTSCTKKTAGMEQNASVLQKRFDTYTTKHPQVTASATINGDCLTSSGTTVTIRKSGIRHTLSEAENDIQNVLKDLQLPTPVGDQIDFFTTSERDGPYLPYSGSAYVSYTRPIHTDESYESYQYDYDIEGPTPCRGKDATIVCSNGSVIGVDAAREYLSSKIVTTYNASITFDPAQHTFR